MGEVIFMVFSENTKNVTTYWTIDDIVTIVTLRLIMSDNQRRPRQRDGQEASRIIPKMIKKTENAANNACASQSRMSLCFCFYSPPPQRSSFIYVLE